MRTDTQFSSGGDRCDAWLYAAETETLAGPRGHPCVVMGHGFGATRDAGLTPFAERFAAAGCHVLVFDYRGYGTSGGEPRQDVDHRRHRADYRAAVAHARMLPDVDPDRVVLWGSSYSGGHVIAVAARDHRVAAVISQGAAMDGFAATLLIRRYAGIGQLLRLTGHAVLDLLGAAARRPPHTISVVGPPGSAAPMSAAGAEEGYQAIIGPTFRNEMRARGILRILVNRPVALAKTVEAPLLLVLATRDEVAPPESVQKVAERAGGPVEVLTLECGHFDIYLGEPFERSVTAQVAFLERVVTPS